MLTAQNPCRRAHRLISGMALALMLITACQSAPSGDETPSPAPTMPQASPSPIPTASPTPATGSPTPAGTPTGTPVETPFDTPFDTTQPGAFPGTELLGRPTDTSITLSTLSTQALEVSVELGRNPGDYISRTPVRTSPADIPLETVLSGLEPNTRYYYRTLSRTPGTSTFFAGVEHTFMTQRPPGQAFVFTLQADSHLDNNSDLSLYQITLNNALNDQPDFHIDLGDTFMCEKFSEPFTADVVPASDYDTVDERYVYERGNFGLLAHSVSLFLVNGNHEGETGWLLDDTVENIPVWATTARQTYYLNPTPDGFFSGDPTEYPYVGERASYYAWEWGDALFIALDPYWNTETNPKKAGGWGWTLGQSQYEWLRTTLETSPARFKFLFIHHLLGGVDEQARGGAEAAPYYEWGGLNADDTWGFDTQRPGWGKPIHTLLVENGVNVVFHGHDHVYVQQLLDGVVYQETPQPSCPNYNNATTLAQEGGYTSGVVFGSSGHLRVSVTSAHAIVDYVRAYRPQDEKGSQHNGQITYSYELLPR